MLFSDFIRLATEAKLARDRFLARWTAGGKVKPRWGRLAKFVEKVRPSAAAKDRHAIAGFYARRRKRPVRCPSAGLLDGDDKERALGLPLDFLNSEAGKGASFRRDHDRDFQPQCAEIQFHLAPALGILDDTRDSREKDHR